MPQPVTMNNWEVMMGIEFKLGGTMYSSGFNMEFALAFGCSLFSLLAAFLLPKITKNNIPLRICVGLSSVASFVLLTIGSGALGIGAFGADGEFITSLNAALAPRAMRFTITTPFALLLTLPVLNILTCVTTDKFTENLIRYKWFYLMILPTILFVIVFVYIPMVGLVIIFLDYNISDIWQSTWVGLKWFNLLFNSIDGEFGRILSNTLIISVGKMVVGFPAPIILALLFNECENVGYKRVIQTLSYLPHFVSWSIIGGLVIQLFSSQYSILNGILKMMGKREYYLLNEVGNIRWTLILTQIWKGVGWSTIIYMAALTAVNPELYESAKLDGAGKLMQTWHITLPGISHIIVMQLIFTLPGLLGDNFDQALNLVYPLTVEKGKTLSMYIYDIGIRGRGNLGLGGNYSYSTVIGLCNSIISLILLITANQVGKRINEEAAIW